MKEEESKKIASDKEKEKDLKALQKKIAEEKKARDLEIQNFIFSSTESFTRKDIEKKQDQIKFLIGGKETTIGEVKETLRLLRKEAKEYKVTFIPSFYDGLRKVTGYKKRKDKPHYKPSIFAHYTLRFIYSRFLYKGLIEELRRRNPLLVGLNMRNFKHFQFLDKEAQNMLEGYMHEMIAVLEESNSFIEFEEKYCKKYRLIWTQKLF